MTARIPLRTPVPAALGPELARRLFYVSPEIIDFKLIEEAGSIHGVELVTRETAGTELTARLSDKVHTLIAAELSGQRDVTPRTVWRSSQERSCHADTFQGMVATGLAFETGPGQVALAEPLMALMDHLDARVRDIAKGAFAAKEYRYPTLLPTRVLEDLDYFAAFPQFVMFVTHLHNDIDVYRDFLADFAREPRISAAVFSRCRDHDSCLPPTMCYHTYHQLRGSTLEGDRVITARGKSFRFESRYQRGLERLWDFTIREIVFLGERDFVLACREDFMKRAQALVEELGLSGHCEVATDPFFAGPETAARIFTQQMMELKYELRLNVGPDATIAVASFNFHDALFGQSFAIQTARGDSARTACVGFGLERLLYAFCCQHGLDPSRWPAAVRQATGGSV